MNKIFKVYLTICTMLFLIIACHSNKSSVVSSPDGTVSLNFFEEQGCVYYAVNKAEVPLLGKSRLGIEYKGGSLSKDLKVVNIECSTYDSIWHPVWGEESSIEDHYNEMKVELTAGADRIRFNIVFRVFDDGVGFRYEFPKQKDLQDFIITDEISEFNIVEDSKSWSLPAYTMYYEGLYEEKNISKLDTVCTPLTIKTKSGMYLAIHEANLTDYAAMNLFPENGTTKLQVELSRWSTGEKVFVTNTRVSPWRTLIIANSAGDLLLSRLMLNLNEPCKIEDTSWIKTERYIGIWWAMHMESATWHPGPKHGATTDNTKRYIDFAAANKFSGVLVEGWNYGWENDWTKEGDKFSFTKAYPDFDIKEVTDYAKSKGVSLIGHNETGGASQNYENQLEDAFKFYHKYGVHAVKTGYVGPLLDKKEYHSSQYGVRHYRKVIETAAKYQIAIDNHEPVMPTGLQRTYPNLMSHEGARGQEYNAWSPDGGNPPEHTTILPFTRGLAGPIDFTPGIFNFENPVYPNTRPQTTVAKQLALYVVIYSPLQMASDIIDNYKGRKEFEFITSCPTNWAKTVVPNAEIGQFATIARKDKDSDNWFVGSITNKDARSISVKLDFLDSNAKYMAKIFCDGDNADYRTNPYDVIIKTKEVNNTSVLDLKLAPSGGAAVILSKIL